MAQRSRGGVKRLFVKDPYNKNSNATAATFSPVADQFTNNPNPAFDPSKHPGKVTRMGAFMSRITNEKPGKASRGHQKVVRPNRQTLFSGKTLVRRTGTGGKTKRVR